MEDPTTPGAQVTIPPGVLDDLTASNWLSSGWTVLVVIVVVALVLVLGVVWIWRRRHHDSHRLRVAVVGGAAVVLVTFAVATGVNAYVGYVPNLAGASRLVHSWIGTHEVSRPSETTGSLHVLSVPGDAAGTVGRTDAWVYTPPGYDAAASTRYPVVYLIHGDPGRPADWFVAGDANTTMDTMLAHGLVQPMILVSIDVNGGHGSKDTECLDWDSGPRIESWIQDVVVPTVDSTYKTVPDRAGRALGGMSSGGFCALDQSLRHLGTWSVALAFEGFGDPGTAGPLALGDDQARIDAVSPRVYVPTMDFTQPLAVYLDVGSETADVPAVRELGQALAARGQAVLFRVNQGQSHTWAEVQAGLPYALVFASQRLSTG